MSHLVTTILALSTTLLVGAATSAATNASAFGPLYHEYRLTLREGERTESFGPFWGSERSDTHAQWAIPPLLSWHAERDGDFEEYDFLYPLLSYNRTGKESRWQLFQFISFSSSGRQDDSTADRTTLFPFYWSQRSQNPDENYTALFPIYGQIKNRLLRDEIEFVLFPLYAKTRKRDVVTQNYLFPFFHTRHGEKLDGWQFWPLIGHEKKDLTQRTDGFGDVTPLGGHEKLFVLWPFYHHNRFGLGTTNEQTQHALLPLFVAQHSAQRDHQSVLWPFFYRTEDRERKTVEYGAPWPLIVSTRGEGRSGGRFWPFYGHTQTTNSTREFLLWPLYRGDRIHAAPLEREHRQYLLFLYQDIHEKNTATGATRERHAFWPLFTHRRELDGSERTQLFAPLEPLMLGNAAVERNWSPLWAIWRSEKNGKTGASSQSLLWNLYRQDETPESKNCSLLFGLLQYQQDKERTRWRLFFVPFDTDKKPASP
ncbi:MAG: hypothetical protein EXS29_03465 [Pedosphaera sp.]|nr:hypothetical protein [Pedosphaera sp.]